MPRRTQRFVSRLSLSAILFLVACACFIIASGQTGRDDPFTLPADAPEQELVQAARSTGLPLPAIKLVPPELVRVYVLEKNEAARWCRARATPEDCIQALAALEEGPFIDHEQGRIWLHAELALAPGKSAPMLRELARQLGETSARQLIAAHEIAHVAFRLLPEEQARSALRTGLNTTLFDTVLLNDDRFYEAFCNFFSLALTARVAKEDTDGSPERTAHALAQSLRILRADDPFYPEMAAALDRWTVQGMLPWESWQDLTVHALQQAARLAVAAGWIED